MDSTNLGPALITGASSGIGAIYADHLARRSYDSIVVARNREKLTALSNRLAEETGRSVKIMSADLNKVKDLARVEDELRHDASITMLVKNAGMGATRSLLETNNNMLDAMIRLNVVALARLTYAVIPGFVARKKGIVINMASIVAIAPELLNGVYGASKVYVLAFSQSFQSELAGKGIQIQAVLPGAIATDFWELSGMPISELSGHIVMTAYDLVDAALAGLDQGEAITIPSLPDRAEWDKFDAARRDMSARLSSTQPAARYGLRA